LEIAMKENTKNVDVTHNEGVESGRRNFLKASAAGTALGALTLSKMMLPETAEATKEEIHGPEVRTLHEFPHKVGPNYKPPRAGGQCSCCWIFP